MNEQAFQLLMAELQGIKTSQAKLWDAFNEHKEKTTGDIAGLKVKSSVWGVLGGALVTIGAVLMAYVKGVFGGGNS